MAIDSPVIIFDWDHPIWKNKNNGDELFEELCYEIVEILGYRNIRWRGKTHDKGRDLQAEKFNELAGDTEIEKWWFQCKRYSSGINRNDIGDAIDFADAEGIDYFVIMTSSRLTNQFQEMIEGWNNNKVKSYKTKEWNHKKIETLVTDNADSFANIEKYFELDRTIEGVRKELKIKEQNAQTKNLDRLNSLKIKLKSAKEEGSIKHELVSRTLNLCEELYASNLKNESIKLCNDLIATKLLSQSQLVKAHVLLGDIYFKREWIFQSIREYRRAEKETTSKDFELSIKLAKALRTNRDYTQAKSILDLLYQEYSKHKKDNFCLITIELAKLELELGDNKKANTYLSEVKSSGILKYLPDVIYLQMKLYNQDGKWKKSIKAFKELDNFQDKPLKYQTLTELSFSHLQKGDLDTAIDILESKCIPIAKEFSDEDRLMVTYQNLTYAKNARNDKYESYWESFDNWSNMLNSNLTLFDDARIKSLNSSDLLSKEKYDESLSDIYKSQKIYSDLGSWVSHKSNLSRVSNTYFQSGELIKALAFAIDANDETLIKKVSIKAIEKKLVTQINELISSYIEKVGLTISQRIGFTRSLIHVYDILNSDLINEIFLNLLNQCKSGFSMDSKFDIQRPSLKALKSISSRLKNSQLDLLYSQTFKTFFKNESSWLAREIVYDIYINIITSRDKLPNKTIIDHLISLYKSDLVTDSLKVKNKGLLNLIGKATDNKTIEDIFLNLELNNETIWYKLNLNLDLGDSQVPKIANFTKELIQSRVVIETDFEPGSGNPKIYKSRVTRTYRIDEKRITVGSIPSLKYLYDLDFSAYPDLELELINASIRSIRDKYNSIYNRISLIRLLCYWSNTDENKSTAVKFFESLEEKGLEYNSKSFEDIWSRWKRENVVRLVNVFAVISLVKRKKVTSLYLCKN